MSGLSRAKTHEAGRQDFGDFGEALGGGSCETAEWDSATA